MTDEMLSQCVHAELDEFFGAKGEEFFKSLSTAYAPRELDMETFKLIYRAMFLSSQYSVQYMLRWLENSGVIQLPPDGAAILSLLEDKKAPPEPPDLPAPE